MSGPQRLSSPQSGLFDDEVVDDDGPSQAGIG
jgi:hypothetical protein